MDPNSSVNATGNVTVTAVPAATPVATPVAIPTATPTVTPTAVPTSTSVTDAPPNTFTFNFSNLPPQQQPVIIPPTGAVPPGDDEERTPEQLREIIKARLEEEVKSHIASLPPVVQRRVRALQKLQKDFKLIHDQYREELKVLAEKYRKLKIPSYDKRRNFITGATEPADTDLLEGTSVAVPTDPTVVPTLPADAKGIPDFWLTVFRNCSPVSGMITERDEPVIKYLIDIRAQEDSKGFILEFEFADNEFFTNKTLVKKYISSTSEYHDDSTFEKSEGTKIEWKTGKDVTHRSVTKPKKGKKGRGRGTVTVVEKVESFFNFF